MPRRLTIALLLAVLGLPASVRGEEVPAAPEPSASPPSLAYPPLNLETPKLGDASADPPHFGRDFSPRVVAAEYFASLSVHVGVTMGFLATSLLVYFLSALEDPPGGCTYAEGICYSVPRLQTSLLAVAAVAPPVIALLSSHAAFRVADNRWGARPALRWTFLVALGVDLVTVALATLFVEGVFSNGEFDPAGAAVTLAAGAVVSAGLQVTVLNLAPSRVAAAPFILRDGGGLALGLRF